MQSAREFTRKSLISGATLGFLAIATGCGSSDAKGPTSNGASQPTSGTPQPATPAWSYEGSEGPEHWGQLSSAYQSCSTGMAQSPIDIPAKEDLSTEPVSFGYTASAAEVTDNGHTDELRAATAQSISVGGRGYVFKQLHFHAPSEHTLAGIRHPAEFHFVHQSDDGGLVVVAVLAAEGQAVGATNTAWAAFIEAAAAHGAVGSSSSAGTIDFAALLPASRNHFAYDGSLTTPPCSENVRWLVMEEAVELNAGQLEKLRAVHSGNSRPVQPVNARKVLLVNQ